MTREDRFRRKWQLVLLAPVLEDMRYDTRLGGQVQEKMTTCPLGTRVGRHAP